ncbi:hypothetical protein [uncultured Pseudosulfitobacter sp.]|uniref:hypothetical protein n=1 Tax=uncultured Pseudosulfitobacter sp. TaxID=2854214 RepID=UPI0030D82230|tara:strand:- start:471 stop:626 length:156 start_codon:yes stop_codon:yes gene_type:complete
MDAAEIADVDAVTAAEDDVVAKASGLDKLRIALTTPAANLQPGAAGVQTGY